MKKRKRGVGFIQEQLGGWIIALLVLILVFFIILLLTGKLSNAFEFAKNIFKARG